MILGFTIYCVFNMRDDYIDAIRKISVYEIIILYKKLNLENFCTVSEAEQR